MSQNYDRMAEEIRRKFEYAPHVAIIGSVTLTHNQSRETCECIGRALAEIPDLVLITGGSEGAADLAARAFIEARQATGQESKVMHILPEGCGRRDYGEVVHAGADMAERREVLGRTASMFIVIEGSPGTVHETEIASSHNAVLLPIGRLGGHAADLYSWLECPMNVDKQDWANLGSDVAKPMQTAQAIRAAVEALQLQPA